MDGEPFPGPVAPAEAIRFFRDKQDAGDDRSFAWQDVWEEEHRHAFTVAKATNRAIRDTIRQQVDRALAEGLTFEQFRAALEPQLVAAGWWGRQPMTDPVTGETRVVQLGSLSRLRTIFDTNVRTASAAGQWERIQRTKERRPYLLYEAVQDSRTRPDHAEWDGTLLPVDHPWWDTHFPPNGWYCRCTVRQLGPRDLARDGLSVSPDPVVATRPWRNRRTGEVLRVPVGIDPGFAYNPGRDRTGGPLAGASGGGPGGGDPDRGRPSGGDPGGDRSMVDPGGRGGPATVSGAEPGLGVDDAPRARPTNLPPPSRDAVAEDPGVIENDPRWGPTSRAELAVLRQVPADRDGFDPLIRSGPRPATVRLAGRGQFNRVTGELTLPASGAPDESVHEIVHSRDRRPDGTPLSADPDFAAAIAADRRRLLEANPGGQANDETLARRDRARARMGDTPPRTLAARRGYDADALAASLEGGEAAIPEFLAAVQAQDVRGTFGLIKPDAPGRRFAADTIEAVTGGEIVLQNARDEGYWQTVEIGAGTTDRQAREALANVAALDTVHPRGLLLVTERLAPETARGARSIGRRQ